MATAVAAATLTPAQRAFWDEQGYLIVRGLFTPAEVAEIREHFDAFAAAGQPVEGFWTPDLSPAAADDPLKRYPRVMHPHRWEALSRRYLLDARVRAVLVDLMNDEPLAAQTMYYYKPPGAKGQALHQDNFYLHVKPGTCVAAWTAIDAATPDNGGMYVVPGTHTMEIVCPEAADDAESFTTHLVNAPAGMKAVPAIMAPGDTLFFNGSLVHGSPKNRSTTQWRRSFIAHYIPAGATHLSQWYKPLYDFEGQEVDRAFTADGGPCGHEATSKFKSYATDAALPAGSQWH